MPNNPNTIIIITAGFGFRNKYLLHLYGVELKRTDSNSFEWVLSREDENEPESGKLPSTPINAMVLMIITK